MRACTRSLPLALVASLALAACGGDDDGGGDGGDGTGADASAGPDGSAGDTPDAAPAGTGAALGQTCNPTGEPMCPDETPFCANFQDATNPYCTVECTMAMMQDPICSDGYTGPGLPGCFVQTMIAGETVYLCGVVCDAPDDQCPPDVCDGTCPGSLQCMPEGNVSFCQ